MVSLDRELVDGELGVYPSPPTRSGRSCAGRVRRSDGRVRRDDHAQHSPGAVNADGRYDAPSPRRRAGSGRAGLLAQPIGVVPVQRRVVSAQEPLAQRDAATSHRSAAAPGQSLRAPARRRRPRGGSRAGSDDRPTRGIAASSRSASSARASRTRCLRSTRRRRSRATDRSGRASRPSTMRSRTMSRLALARSTSRHVTAICATSAATTAARAPTHLRGPPTGSPRPSWPPRRTARP